MTIPAAGRNFAVAALLAVLAAGCGSNPKYSEIKLPLPPSSNSGVVGGQFIQVDYGFGIPLPPKWDSLQLSLDQEVDEVAQFMDPDKSIDVRVSAQLSGASRDLSERAWTDIFGQDLKNRQFKVKGTDKIQEWKASGGPSWTVIPYHLRDSGGGKWADQVWGLNNGDLTLIVHALMAEDASNSEKGRKLFKSLANSLTQIRWYTPIGPRGISLERYELMHFTEGFCKALDSQSAAKVGGYFDDMFSGKAKWDQWYKGLISSKDKSPVKLQTSLSGLVINGDRATASFVVVKTGTSGTEKFDKGFRLSKAEGRWKIVSAIEKK